MTVQVPGEGDFEASLEERRCSRAASIISAESCLLDEAELLQLGHRLRRSLLRHLEQRGQLAYTTS
jgi:hypothetical protein